MEKSEYQKFLDAVGTVCMECVDGCDEVCPTCPVRKTCDILAELQDDC